MVPAMNTQHERVLADLLDDAEERLARIHNMSAHQAELAHRVRLAAGTIQQIKNHVAAGERWTALDELRQDARRARVEDAPF